MPSYVKHIMDAYVDALGQAPMEETPFANPQDRDAYIAKVRDVTGKLETVIGAAPAEVKGALQKIMDKQHLPTPQEVSQAVLQARTAGDQAGNQAVDAIAAVYSALYTIAKNVNVARKTAEDNLSDLTARVNAALGAVNTFQPQYTPKTPAEIKAMFGL